MSSPEDLLTACATSQEERQRLTSRANDALLLWDNWLHPFTSGSETGDDPAYDDNFLLMREEINKISGTDSARLCELARKCLCECAKDIRVVTWYVQARLSRDGEKGLAEGLLLLVAMLTRYGQACHPQRPVARKAALEWLNSAKVIDALLLWPEVDRNDAGLTAGAINLLQSAVADWPEAEKPSFAGLCTALENRLARSGGMEALVPQNSSAQDHGREPAHSDSPQLSAVKSGRDLLDHPTFPPTVRTTFLGVYGVDSPLPTSWLDDIAQSREGHEAATSFLDIFSHRITTQYYRIWRKYAWPATFEAGGRDATSQCLLGLVGLGIPGTAEQVATPVSRFLALLGTMRLPTRNAEGIRALVSLLAPNTRAIITEPDPVKVHIGNRSGLGTGNRIRLSQRATLGKTAKEACSRVLVTLETADPDEAEGWLPGGALHTDLLVLLRVYLGYRSDARLRLTVPVRLLPEPRLSTGRRIQLGRTGLLGLKAGKLSNSRESLTVSLGCYEGLQCSVLSPAEDGHYRFD